MIPKISGSTTLSLTAYLYPDRGTNDGPTDEARHPGDRRVDKEPRDLSREAGVGRWVHPHSVIAATGTRALTSFIGFRAFRDPVTAHCSVKAHERCTGDQELGLTMLAILRG